MNPICLVIFLAKADQANTRQHVGASLEAERLRHSEHHFSCAALSIAADVQGHVPLKFSF